MSSNPNKLPTLRRGLVTLRPPRSSDAPKFIEAAKASRVLHDDLVHPPDTREAFEIYVRRNEIPSNACFLIVENASDRIAGTINLSQISRGAFLNAYLGYYLFEGFTGRSLMAEAMKAVVGFAFGEFGLHRLEANIQPRNVASRRLVETCGFTREGYSRRYLWIAGDWRDHERWAILKEDLKQ
ncbi:MAG TPA: GNAT family protein [Aridibacter sp.]|nr:GNAT family protein [Aridibacter sp.]